MQCELSGKEFEGPGVKVMIEGVEMTVCPEMAHLGKKVIPRAPPKPKVEKAQNYVPRGFGTRIKEKRELMGMRQADLARFLNEKESLIHQLESENIKPSERVLNKLKAKLHLELTKEYDSEPVDLPKSESSGMTLGDLMKKR